MSEEPAKYESKIIETRRGKIHYLEWTSENSPIIIVLPGFTIPALAYTAIGDDFQDYGFSVIIVDYWGRGETGAPTDGKYSLSSQISLVLTLINQLRITKCNIVGISYGAAVAAGLVSLVTEKIDKMAFISPLQFTTEMPTHLQKFVLGAPDIGPMILSWTAPTMVPQLVKYHFQNPDEVPESVERITKICIDQFKSGNLHPYAISKSIAAFEESDIEHSFAGLSAVNKKMIVLIGAEDKLVSASECQSWWTRWIQNASILNCDDLGHLMYFEQESQVAKSIAKFILS